MVALALAQLGEVNSSGDTAPWHPARVDASGTVPRMAGAYAPLCEFDEPLKFMRPSYLNETGELTMQLAFPRFRGTGKDGNAAAPPHRGRRYDEKNRGVVDFNFIENVARRRYAGGASMSRGAYYSVCVDEYGNDGGTLARELSTYIEPGFEDHVIVLDLLIPDQRELLLERCDAPHGIVVEVPVADGRDENPLLVELLASGLLDEFEGEDFRGALVFLPCDVKREKVPDVLDLRQLEAQRWLCRFLPKGNDVFTMPHAREVDFFCDMLPSLMCPERGGADLTNGIGQMLRAGGVQGLVFPSARSDVLCEFENGELSRFYGWNFLDYRDAPPYDDSHPMMVYQDDWATSFGEARIHLAPDDSPYRDSWRIEGQEAQMRDVLSEITWDSMEEISTLKEPGVDLAMLRERRLRK